MRRPCPGSLQSNEGDRHLSNKYRNSPYCDDATKENTECGENIKGTYSNFRKDRSKRSAKVP